MRSIRRGGLDAARARQFQAARMIQSWAKYGFMAASKAVMGLIGVDCGPVRPPLRNLTGEELTAMAAELDGFEVFDRPIRAPE